MAFSGVGCSSRPSFRCGGMSQTCSFVIAELMKHPRCAFEPICDIRRSGSPKCGGQVCSQAPPGKAFASWGVIGPTPGRAVKHGCATGRSCAEQFLPAFASVNGGLLDEVDASASSDLEPRS